MAGKKLNQTQRNVALEALRKGERPAQIAKALGVHRSTITRLKIRNAQRTEKNSTRTHVTIRLSASEKSRMEAEAARFGYASISAYGRALIRKGGDFFEPNEDIDRHLRDFLSAFGHMGNNINQIASALNTSLKRVGRADLTMQDRADVDALDDKVVALRSFLTEILRHDQRQITSLVSDLERAI